jgi:hypothetical protein
LLLACRLVAEDTLGEARSFDKRTRLLFENGEAAQADVVKAAGQSPSSSRRYRRRSSMRGWRITIWPHSGPRTSPCCGSIKASLAF